MLAGIGDDRSRFADARGLKAYAGSARRRREAGDRHTAAQRNLFNRMLGCLHHCLIHRVCYNESVAFPAPSDAQHAEAA